MSEHEPDTVVDPDVAEAIGALAKVCLGTEVRGLEPVTPGLGLRRFYRVRLDARGEAPASAIARVEAEEDPTRRPAGVPPEPPLEPIRRFLEDAGIPVPRSFGRDDGRGIALLEDLGDWSLEAAAAEVDAAERRALYREVCDWLPRLQALERGANPPAAFERRLDERLLRYKAEQLIRWGLPWALGREPSAGETSVIDALFTHIGEVCRAAPARLSHRDLKAANVFVRRDAAPGRRVGFIDLQGAFLAPPEYDLVCLLHDSHVPLPVSEVDAHLAAIRPQLPDAPSADELARRFHLLTLSRVGKDLSLYLYAAKERGDRRYLRFVPNAARALRRSAARAARAEPRLADAAELIGRMPEAPCGP